MACSSRIRCRTTVKKIFLSYITIEPPWSEHGVSSVSEIDYLSNPNSAVTSVFPASFKDNDILKTAVQFALPCVPESGTVDVFTFVLTSGDSKWTFGYCRHPPGLKKVTVFLSFLPWQEIFFRALNYCAELEEGDLVTFLERLYVTPVPEPGTRLYIPMKEKPFNYQIMNEYALPSIPENRNVSEFYNALRPDAMLTLFAALLSERRIVVTSKKLSRVSSIVMAANSLIFPMSWQHIFIPILPSTLQDYLCAPMPFLIGVPRSVWNLVSLESIGQIVHIDADNDTATTPFPEDLSSIPEDISTTLRKSLKRDRVLGDGLARAFLRALAQLMGHYQDAIEDNGSRFDPNQFVQYAHPSHRSYIKDKLLKLQIFQQFVEERLERIKSGSCESDEFELESLAWRSHSRSNGKNGLPVLKSLGSQNVALRKAGKAVMMSVKRESGHLIDSVKHNSALKSAFRSVKEGGKSVKQKGHVAYSDIKSKFYAMPSVTLNNTGGPIRESFSPAQDSKSYRRHTSMLQKKDCHMCSFKECDLADCSFPRISELPHNLPLPNQSTDHQIMSSVSATNLPDYSQRKNGQVSVTPRLSKSEENLIDLETPEDGGFVYTLENPLYDLVTNNAVFEDIVKTDDQLLAEYGLNDYFSKLKFSTQSWGNGSRPTSGSEVSASSNQSQQSSDKWTTFD